MGSDIVRDPSIEDVHISIHAPAWGATVCVLRLRFVSRNFNPRSRMGSDRQCGTSVTQAIYFNPRSRMGSDGCECMVLFDEFEFQSTLPHGERPWSRRSRPRRCCDFNPRSRMGSDGHIRDDSVHRQRISIHAPAWGATGRGFRRKFNDSDFNPRSRMGSDTSQLH